MKNCNLESNKIDTHRRCDIFEARREGDMTQLLEKVFSEASKLSELEQNALARWLIEEMRSEKKWEHSFSESEEMLSHLADEALNEYKKGKAEPLNLDE